MATITTAASAATHSDMDPNAISTFVQTLQGNPFGALCLLLICMLIYMSYREKGRNSRKEKKNRKRA